MRIYLPRNIIKGKVDWEGKALKKASEEAKDFMKSNGPFRWECIIRVADR